ncbi:MAG: hypothetical protein FGM18_09985 [Burkholderiaceae bacterium]|nr:hypothetical protein [Burkholderiaceae bacterium]
MTESQSLHHRWLFGILIPFVYLVIELAFNHRLVEVTAGTVDNEVLSGLEFWGRMISGVGLGLVFFRTTMLRIMPDVFRLVLCLSLGILVMWQLQKTLADFLISTASESDKKAAIILCASVKEVASGNLRAKDDLPFLNRNVDAFEKKVVMAIFPAAGLHVSNREAQLSGWADQLGMKGEMASFDSVIQDNAFRNLIISPIAMGFSIFFALFNLALLLGSIVALYGKERWRTPVAVMVLLGAIFVSLLPGNAFMDSPGYEQTMRAGLWKNEPVIALLVEWSMRATPTWGVVSEVAHRYLLLDFSFRSF